MGLNDKLMHQRLFAEKAGGDLGGAMRAHLKKRSAEADKEFLYDDLSQDAKDYMDWVLENGEDVSTESLKAYGREVDLTSEQYYLIGDQVGVTVDSSDWTEDRSARPRTKAKKPKGHGAATAQDRSEARLAEALSRVSQCAEAANAFWLEGNQAEALAALEDLLAESKATRQAITSHADKFPLVGEVMEDGEVSEQEMVGEDAEAVAMAAGEKSLKRKGDSFSSTGDYLVEVTLDSTLGDEDQEEANSLLQNAAADYNCLNNDGETFAFAEESDAEEFTRAALNMTYVTGAQIVSEPE